MNDTKEFYNDSAIDWAKDSANDEIMLPVLKKFLSIIPQDETILDIGCGTGYETRRIKELGFNVTGIDFSEASIKIAKQHSPEIDFRVGNALENVETNMSFAGCIAIALIIHFTEDELELFLNNIYDILADKGKLLLVFRVGCGIDSQSSNKIYKGKSYYRPTYLYNAEDILKIANKKFYLYEEIESDSEDWKNIVLEKS